MVGVADPLEADLQLNQLLCSEPDRRKFLIILSLKISHLKCVATLPCEMIVS